MTAGDCRSPSAMWERAEPITEARRLLQLVLSDTDFGVDLQRSGCRIVAKQHSHRLFRNGGEARGCSAEDVVDAAQWRPGRLVQLQRD